MVDLRSRTAYAADHVRGTVSIGLADPFATYLGWTIPRDAPLTLIGDSHDDVLDARRQLARVGIDQMVAAVGAPSELAGDRAASYRRATSADLAAERRERRERRDEIVVVPEGEVRVHGKSGYRASIGASLMDCFGRDVVHIDDDWDDAEPAGNNQNARR